MPPSILTSLHRSLARVQTPPEQPTHHQQPNPVYAPATTTPPPPARPTHPNRSPNRKTPRAGWTASTPWINWHCSGCWTEMAASAHPNRPSSRTSLRGTVSRYHCTYADCSRGTNLPHLPLLPSTLQVRPLPAFHSQVRQVRRPPVSLQWRQHQHHCIRQHRQQQQQQQQRQLYEQLYWYSHKWYR